MSRDRLLFPCRPDLVKSALLLAAITILAMGDTKGAKLHFRVTYPAGISLQPLDGRLLLFLSKDDRDEPRFQISDFSLQTQQVFGTDVDGWRPEQEILLSGGIPGYPLENLSEVPPGTYTIQALLHRYETFHRSDGSVVKLPMDRGEGQQWNRAPGNLFSRPRKLALDPGRQETVNLALDQIVPVIPVESETQYIKHERILSQRLTRFWGRPMYLGAHVLLPAGFDDHPEARFPLIINHGHFSSTFQGFRQDPPNADLKPDFSERFQLAGYNRIEQEAAYQFYKDWAGPGFPRMLIVEIQHPNPYYDDSYAVNSANLGPYGDAINQELIPYIEKKYRAIGAGWARFLYGGSTGGWEALASQIFYPDEYNGCFAACPDPIDFRAYTVVDIYQDTNAYFFDGTWARIPRPGYRNYLGHLSATIEQMNRLEFVLGGTQGRSGGQWDIWQAVFSPVGRDGYPKPIWDKQTGVIDHEVAAYWRENYDLSYILRRDWDHGLGNKLRGKIHIYVGEMDNYYLNNAVYLVEEFLKDTRNPPFEGEIKYGERAEHCWNGDPARPNALSRLRYHQLFASRIVERILKTAPPGGDVTSWRY